MVEANGLREQDKQPPAEHKSTSDILSDAVHSALYSAVQEPVTGLTQIYDAFKGNGSNVASKVQFMEAPKAAQFGTADWHAQQIGSAVGMLAPFMLMHKGVKGTLGAAGFGVERAGMTGITAAEDMSLLAKRTSFGMNMAEAGITGFGYDAFLRPSDSNHTGDLSQFLADRGTQGTIGAATFMTMTGAGLGLNRLAGSSMLEKSALVPILKNPITSGVLSGVPAAFVSTESHSLVKTGELASSTELAQSVYQMSLIGGGFGAVHALAGPGEAGAPSKIEQFKDKVKSNLNPEVRPREGLALLSGDDTVGPKDEPGGKKPFDGDPDTEKGLEDITSKWKGRADAPSSETPVDKPAEKTDTPPVVDAPVDKPVSTLDMLNGSRTEASGIINPALRDATTDSAAKVENTEAADTTAPKRKVEIPEVAVERAEDLKTGVVALHNVLKSQEAAKSAADGAFLAEAKAQEPLATDDVVQLATQARERATQLKQEAEQKRQAFTDFVNEKGDGLRTHLEDVAKQLKYPERAREIVTRDFTVKEGKQLLSAATADGATPESRAAFEQFVREKGGDKIRPELEKLAAEEKNADVAKALLEKAFAPRAVSITVEDVGQQAAMNVGAQILTREGGPDQAALNKFAKDYGPAMEKHMRSAADQLGFGVDAKLQIAEAYHGPELRQGVDLLKANPLDPVALKEFTEGAGKALEQPMAQAALDLGLTPEAQLKVREAYRGQEEWVRVGDSEEYVPVDPARAKDFRTGIALMEQTHANNAPGYYIDIMRNWIKSPDNADLVKPMRDYAELSNDPHIQAFMREMEFPTENMTVTGKPSVIQVSEELGSGTPEAFERRNRFNDFLELTDALKNAPDAELANNRQQLFNWLNRNDDVYDAAVAFAKQSADSRVVSALDSYFGTNNMKEFIEAKAKHDKVSDEITPDLIQRLQKPGAELFWELAPEAVDPPRMWGGNKNISESRQAKTVTTDGEGNVIAEFNAARHPQGVAKVTDAPDGTRTVEYGDGAKFIQLPQGYDMDVKPDGSWMAKFSNGNYIIENAEGPISKIVYENGAETTLYRNGEVRRTSVDDQTASKWLDGTKLGAEDARPEEQGDAAADPAKPAKDGVLTRDQVSALTEKLSSSDYSEASTAAILLKNGFGKMTDTQFVQWLNFALGSHPDAFSRTPRQLPNWPDLHMRADGQVFLEDNVQELLRGGKTPAEQQSQEGRDRAYEGRTLVRNFLDAPEDRPSTLQYPAWLVKANNLPPESLPRTVLRDIRARFSADKLPPDVAQYLEANPEKPSKGRDGKVRGPFQLSNDDLPTRMKALSDTLQYAPKDIQQKLLQLGSEDARALRDVLSAVTPPRGPRDRAQPAEFEELLDLTVPQAEDIYTVRLMIQAIKDAASQREEKDRAPLEEFAVKAASRLLPEDEAGQKRVMELVSGIASGKIRAPWVPDAERENQPPPEKPGSGKHKGTITREDGLRPGEQYPTDEQLAQMDGEEPTAFDDTQLTGTRNDEPLDNWQQYRDDPEADLTNPLLDGGHDIHGIIGDGIDDVSEHGDGL
ncbi:MAG TPA: hypothetical protein V6C76_02470 [Drouetiella sp.]